MRPRVDGVCALLWEATPQSSIGARTMSHHTGISERSVVLAVSHVCGRPCCLAPSFVAVSRRFLAATFLPPRGRPTLVALSCAL